MSFDQRKTNPIPNKQAKLLIAELLKEDFMESPIEKLDQDSLICIFNKLPVTDLVRIERVSKSWQQVAKQSWSSFKVLTLDPRELGLRTVGTRHAYPKINQELVEEILKRCGKYLLEFILRYDGMSYTFTYTEFDYMLLMANSCKNIQSINLFKSTCEGIKELSENCCKIQELKLFVIHFGNRKKLIIALGNLVSNNRNFRSLISENDSAEDLLLSAFLDKTIKTDTEINQEILKITKQVTNKLSYFKSNLNRDTANALF